MRIVHKLAALMSVALAAGAGSAGLVTFYDLHGGFSAYLRQRDEARVRAIAAALEDEVVRAGGPDALRDDAGLVPRLMARVGPQEGEPPDRPPPFGRRPPPGRGGGPPVAVVSADGTAWAGPRLPGALPFIEAPVLWHGSLTAYVRTPVAPPIPGRLEADFLAHQSRHLAVLASLLAVLGAGVSLVVARLSVRPILALSRATARIAAGDFSARVAATGGDEIGDALRDVNAMAEALGRLEQARRTWLAQMAHELRTPLAVLRGEIEALQDGVRQLGPPAVMSLAEEVRRLTALVEDLHLLALADLKALPCVFTEQDGAAVVRAAVARFAARAAAAGLALRQDIPADPVMVRCDRNRIDQLIANLMENSLRYTDSPGRIEVSVSAAGGHVRVCFDDTAPGVDDAALAQLFTPLFRAEASRSRAHGGSGLGLSLARAIAEAHGGTLRAAPSRLGGLAMILLLPEGDGA